MHDNSRSLAFEFSIRTDILFQLSLLILIEILYEYELVVFLVEYQLVNSLRREHYAKPSGPDSFLLAYSHVPEWIICRVSERRVLDFVHTSCRASRRVCFAQLNTQT